MVNGTMQIQRYRNNIIVEKGRWIDVDDQFTLKTGGKGGKFKKQQVEVGVTKPV